MHISPRAPQKKKGFLQIDHSTFPTVIPTRSAASIPMHDSQFSMIACD